jgi:hypothetical protein
LEDVDDLALLELFVVVGVELGEDVKDLFADGVGEGLRGEFERAFYGDCDGGLLFLGFYLF